VQATLLSIAVAFILALVAALVGPHFVDWNKYRSEFETQASRMTGLQVRIGGPIDARLLPTPSLNLQRIDIARPGEAGSLRARRLSIEFSLGSLARGEFRASEVILEGAEITAALDRRGRLEWPAPSVGFDPEAISIARLDIRDSRALLADAASGYGVVLDKFEFKGELKTLSGPVKGQGSFYVGEQHYPYRLTASRVGDGGARVRLTVDPLDLSLTADADGFLSFENGTPRFVGSITLARSLIRAPSGSQSEILEPWRLTGKIDGSSERAVAEQIEFQFGPDERPIRLRGDALVNFGASPRITGVFSSPQIDLDRILALPEPRRQHPPTAIKAFVDLFAGARRPPIPISLGISVESLLFAGATLQRVSADFASEANGWNVEKLELRAPGLSQLAMSGRLDVSDGISFSGRTRLVSRDTRALIAWLTNHPEEQVTAAASLSVDGDFKVARDAIAIERLKAEFDRMSVEGRLVYSWGNDQRAPRIEAAVTAPDIDLDRAHALLQSLFEGSGLDRPREGLLSAKIARATLAGVEVKGADVSVRFDPQSLNIERLAVGDFGGASVSANGTIDIRAPSPRGAVKLELDAQRLDGVATLVERVAPRVAAELRRNAGRLMPAKLQASLEVTAATSSAAVPLARFKVDGTAGVLRVGLRGDIGAGGVDLTDAGLARLRSAPINLDGRFEADEGAELAALFGLERFVAVDKGLGRIAGTVRGALDGPLSVNGSLTATGLESSVNGRLRLPGNQGATADLDVKIVRADVRMPASAGRGAESLPVTLAARLSLADGSIGLSDLKGTVGGAEIGGHIAIGMDEPIKVGGEVSLGTLHLPAAVGAMIGISSPTPGRWPTEPFDRGLIGGAEGSLKMRIDRVSLSPQLSVADVRGVLQLGPDTFSLEEFDGAFAGGRIAGTVTFERGDHGLGLDGQVRFAAINLAELIRGHDALTGRATIDLNIQGTGRSPVALIGSMKGDGTFTVQDGAIMYVDPSVFAEIIRSVDEGLPIDAERIRERTEAFLDKGALSVGLAQGEIVIAAGQLRLANTAIRAKGANLGVSANVDLSAGAIEARLVLSGAPGSGALEGIRPEIALMLRGSYDELKRTLDVATFANWLALRAIEEKDKRINALQTGREIPVRPPEPSQSDVTSTTNPPVAPPPAVPAAPPAIPSPIKSAPAAPHQVPKTLQRSPATRVAPPTDIRPPPATRPQIPPKQVSPQRPTSRSWLERLLNP
jgi:AsmA family/AsmA-like C-terminal region